VTSVMEILFARRPCINYVSPAICEGDVASGSGFGVPIIVLEPFGTIPQVGGLVIAGEFPGPFFLDWTPVPGALCYNIYQVIDGELVLIFECVPQPPEGPGHPLPPGSPGGGDTYVVTPITPEGEGPPGNPVTTPTGGDPGCIDGWKLLETMNPQFVLTWFNGENPLPAGNYKLVYESGAIFDTPSCPGMYTTALLFILRWNDGTSSTSVLFEDGWGCFATALAQETAAHNDPYFFVHSFGKIGVNPDGANTTTVSLYVACP